ncbi:hypothetical protein T12_12977 [Trichinella patagoniensis]|uniref:Uncharacterized protein n=1 Tax=Trichinella patagoniensis TaxID=990121 RepID=A0A0V0ZU40_9BILA|nr:hypothetical protein T12_12977 [Trichinella patagoniensis]
MQIRIAITLPYHQFKEWSKENVKTRTARSRTREGKRIGVPGTLSSLVLLRVVLDLLRVVLDLLRVVLDLLRAVRDLLRVVRDLLRVVRDLLRVVRVFTSSFLH